MPVAVIRARPVSAARPWMRSSFGLYTEVLLGELAAAGFVEGGADQVERGAEQGFEVGTDQGLRQGSQHVLRRCEAGDRLGHALRIHRELKAHRAGQGEWPRSGDA